MIDPRAGAAPPSDWPVLVTGAGGFVGGHVARELARAGHRVRALTRNEPVVESGDPPLDWFLGDLGRDRDRTAALRGMRGVVHVAGWVCLGRDPSGQSHQINVESTRALLEEGAAGTVERFVYTSTLWTTAAGTAAQPADEASAWNLHTIRSPYCDTKRAAERIVLERNGPKLRTTVLCPAMVIGPRDLKPTSTSLLLALARSPAAVLPRGGIPLIDARVLAVAHRRALDAGAPGARYIVAGPYLSYPDLARLVARVAGRPWFVATIPDGFAIPFQTGARLLSRVAGARLGMISEAVVAGGFLRLHATGARADAAFDLRHPPPMQSIYETLADHQRSGRAPWLKPLRAREGLGPWPPAAEPAATRPEASPAT